MDRRLGKGIFIRKRKIQNEVCDYIVRIHHIGSTAVKKLSAKPIIDIAVEINDFSVGENCVSPLAKIGYSYKGINILPDRHYFSKGEPRTHQIHMYQSGNKFLHEQLKFRDYLRNNEKARIEYEELKYKLSELNNNKHKYTEKKTQFVKSILEQI